MAPVLSICAMSLPVEQHSPVTRESGISCKEKSECLKQTGFMILSASFQTLSKSQRAGGCFHSIELSFISLSDLLSSLIVYNKPKVRSGKRKMEFLSGIGGETAGMEDIALSLVPLQDRNSKIKTRGSALSHSRDQN